MNKKIIKTAGFILALTLFLYPIRTLAETNGTTVSFPVVKSVLGTSPANDTFTFELTPEQANIPMPEKCKIEIQGNGTAEFGKIRYTEPGDYHYTIQEKPGNKRGYTYDASQYAVTVQVITDEQGNLSAFVWMTKIGEKYKVQEATFENIYITQSEEDYTTKHNISQDKTNIPTTSDNTVLIPAVLFSAAGLAGMIWSLKKKKEKR